MKKLILLLGILTGQYLSAQEWGSLDSGLVETDFATATFKSTRLINQHTTEILGKRTLDFKISHRFGPANLGGSELWGLDGPANIRLGLEYSFDGRFMFGFGRSSSEKMFDGFLKYKLLRQKDSGAPVTVTLLTGAYYTAEEKVVNSEDVYENSTMRMSYCFEAMIARKFSNRFSFQLAPWFVHYNLVDSISDKNDVYGVSGLFRLKFTKRAAITAEYALRINKYSDTKYYDSMAIGYELETGGHVFQIHFTNSSGIVENQFFANEIGLRKHLF